jgi:hypothetical protein
MTDYKDHIQDVERAVRYGIGSFMIMVAIYSSTIIWLLFDIKELLKELVK